MEITLLQKKCSIKPEKQVLACTFKIFDEERTKMIHAILLNQNN